MTLNKTQQALCLRILQYIADQKGTPVSRTHLTIALNASLRNVTLTLLHLHGEGKLLQTATTSLGAPTYIIRHPADDDKTSSQGTHHAGSN